MSQVHNALTRGPWSQVAATVLGDTRGAGIERLGETLTPTMDLWTPARPDWALYRREQLLELHGFAAAVAGELSCVVFEPPLNKTSLLVIEALDITIVGSQVLLGYDIRPAGAAEATTKLFKDTRAQLTGQRPRSKVYSDSNAATALTGGFQRFTPTSGVTTRLLTPWILLGENALGNQLVLIVESGTANLALNVTAHGFERELQPSEQRLTR